MDGVLFLSFAWFPGTFSDLGSHQPGVSGDGCRGWPLFWLQSQDLLKPQTAGSTPPAAAVQASPKSQVHGQAGKAMSSPVDGSLDRNGSPWT